MKKTSKTGVIVLGLFAVMITWAVPQTASALTTQLCLDCHLSSDMQAFHHNSANVPGVVVGNCGTCHVPQPGFVRPDCFQCHDFTGGTGTPVHDAHTAAIPAEIQSCESCHTDGVPGGPMREPFGECSVCHSGFLGGASSPLHVTHINNFGAVQCAICHGADAPACNQCHMVDHHDFRNGVGAEGHDFHTAFITDCQRCHVSGVAGGPLREPFGDCATCHQGFQGGFNGALHQRHTSELGAADCAICHGPDAPACNQCHMVDRHDFRNGVGAQGHDFHTAFIADCQRCHVSGVVGGPVREPFGDCATCHQGFQGGLNGALHQRHTNDFGAADCAICHGPEAPACNQCHLVDRHDFRNGVGAQGHDFHTTFITDCQRCHVSGVVGGPLREPFGDCATCHQGFQGGLNGELHQRHTSTFGANDCATCHGPEAPACNQCHQVDRHDFQNGVGAQGHDFHTALIADCQRCHVSGVAGGPLREPFGECSACHQGFQDGLNGPLHQRHTTTFGATDCNICHGANAPACNQCHQIDRHDFRSPSAQGHIFHTNFISNCNFCHVSGAPGADPVPGIFGACSSCHRGFQGPGGALHDRHTTTFGATDCSTCHGPRAPVCNACHRVRGHDFTSSRSGGHNVHSRVSCSACHSFGRDGRGDDGRGDDGRGGRSGGGFGGGGGGRGR